MEQSPIDIARQALKSLAQSKIPPTPDNFRRVYDEIVGVKSQDTLQLLSKLLKEAGRARPRFAKLAAQLEQAAGKSDWAALEQHLRQLLPVAQDAGIPRMGEVVRELVREMEVSRPGVSLSKKKEALERVLANFGADADVLAGKLHGLTASWRGGLLRKCRDSRMIRPHPPRSRCRVGVWLRSPRFRLRPHCGAIF